MKTGNRIFFLLKFPILSGICFFTVFLFSDATEVKSPDPVVKSETKNPSSNKPLFSHIAETDHKAKEGNKKDHTHKKNVSKDGVRFTEKDARELLMKRVPNGLIMELIQNFDHDRFVFSGRMFLEKAGSFTQNGEHFIINRKYEFIIDAHTGKFIHWKGFDYPQPALSPDNKDRKLIDEAKIKEILLAKVPKATILNIEWDMNENRNYFMGTMYKEGFFYRFVIDAWTGIIIDWKAKERSRSSSADEKEREQYIYMAREKIVAFLHSKVPGAEITRMDLNVEGDIPFFEGQMIHHRSIYFFKINALTGQLADWKQKTSKTPFEYRRHGERTVSMPVIPAAPIVPIPEIPTPPAPPIPPVPFQ